MASRRRLPSGAGGTASSAGAGPTSARRRRHRDRTRSSSWRSGQARTRRPGSRGSATARLVVAVVAAVGNERADQAGQERGSGTLGMLVRERDEAGRGWDGRRPMEAPEVGRRPRAPPLPPSLSSASSSSRLKGAGHQRWDSQARVRATRPARAGPVTRLERRTQVPDGRWRQGRRGRGGWRGAGRPSAAGESRGRGLAG